MSCVCVWCYCSLRVIHLKYCEKHICNLKITTQMQSLEMKYNINCKLWIQVVMCISFTDSHWIWKKELTKSLNWHFFNIGDWQHFKSCIPQVKSKQILSGAIILFTLKNSPFVWFLNCGLLCKKSYTYRQGCRVVKYVICQK